MFMVSDAEIAAIQAAHQRAGDAGATAELMRLFPAVTDYRRARECAQTIAGWLPPVPRPGVRPRHLRSPRVVG